MPQYLCLLYAPADADGSDPERVAEIPEWIRLTGELRDSGVLLGNNPLQAVHAATTVRVRDDEVDLTDGPFAMTKEVLAGYYLLGCDDLDEALRVAARFPTARYGSVEVRPVMDMSELKAMASS